MDLYFRKPTEAETGEIMPIARELYSAFSAQCSRWHYDTYDTSFSTFRLARGQAGKIRPKVPACPRESKSSETTVTSVIRHTEAGSLRSKSQLLAMRKSVTCDAKVSYLRFSTPDVKKKRKPARRSGGFAIRLKRECYTTAAPQKVDTERWKTDGKWLPLQADRVVCPVERA